jgi:hypothetical protein
MPETSAPAMSSGVWTGPRTVTIGTIERAYHHDRALARRLLDVSELSEGWRAWAHKTVRARARQV